MTDKNIRTYEEIVTIAKNCKKKVEKNQRLGVNTSWVYYICKAVMKVKTDFKRIGTIKDAPNPRGNNLNINIYKKDYFDMAKRLIKFVETNKILPSYIKITINDKVLKVRLRDYMYMFSRILVYYDTNGKFPKYANVKSSVFNTSSNTKSTSSKSENTVLKKYGHATDHCCDDMGQNTPYYCGCHSLQEVFRNLTGKVVSQSTIAEVCGTTTSGTDHDGLNTCVAWFNKKYGYNLSVEWKNFSDIGWSGVKKIIDSNNQDCVVHNLYRDQYGHYEVINKVYNNYSDVQNSLGDKCSNGCYYGYVEERYHSTFESYMSGISQKSIMIITRK